MRDNYKISEDHFLYEKVLSRNSSRYYIPVITLIAFTLAMFVTIDLIKIIKHKYISYYKYYKNTEERERIHREHNSIIRSRC